MEDSRVKISLSSPLFRESAYAILGLSLASWWDFLLDQSSLAFTWTTKHYQNDKNAGIQVLVPFEKFVFLCCVTVVPMVVLIPVDHPRLVLIFTSAVNSQIILFAGFVGALCTRCHGKYFPRTITMLAMLAFNIMTMMIVYLVNHEPSLVITPTQQKVLTSQWVFAGLYLIAVVRWFYGEFVLHLLVPRSLAYYAALVSMVNALFRKSSPNKSKKEDEIDWKRIHRENTAYYPIMYALIALLCLLFLAGVYGLVNPIVFELSDHELFLINLPALVHIICMIVLSSQVSKHAIVAYLHALLESKKSYVR
jgi:hypothetical protein